jgi:tetratricopeptide (TPR) repeat protein
MPLLPLLVVLTALADSPRWEPGTDAAVQAYNTAVQALERGEPTEAERQLRRALRRDPDCGMCSHALALALMRQDRAAEAFPLAQELHGRFPEEIEAAITYAETAFAAEHFELTIEVAEGLLAEHPERWESLTLLVRGLLRSGDTARARAALQQAGAHHSAERLACQLGKVALEERQLDQARQHLARCREGDDPEAADALEVRVLSMEGRFEEAREVRRDALDPQLALMYEAYGAMRARDFEVAAELLRGGLKDHPNDAEMAVLLGMCELRLGREEQAMAALERAFEAETWINVGSRGGLAGILTASGERTLRLQMREAAAQLAMLQARAGRHQDAAATLARASSEHGLSGELAAAHLELLVAQERWSEAQAVALAELGRWPDSELLVHTASALAIEHEPLRTPALELRLAQAGELGVLFNAAAQASDRGDYAGCLARLEGAPAASDPEAAARVLRLAHACACAAGDLAVSDRLLDQAGGAQGVEPFALVNHANLLLGAQRVDAALALLAAVPPESGDPELDRLRRSLLLSAHVRGGDLPAALAVVEQGSVDPVGRIDLAVMLANEQRYEEALPLLRGACPELADAAERERCEAVQAQIEGLTGGG